MQTPDSHNHFEVPFDYRVIFADDVFAPDRPLLADVLNPSASPSSSLKPARAIVFVDDGLAQADRLLTARITDYFRSRASRIVLAAQPIVVTGGEGAKSDMKVFEKCVRALHDSGIDRHSYAIAIGGGAMIDAAGFAASVVHRGVRQVRLPTTVLSQNDAGIGVKNGVDYFGKKNFLGCFSPPRAVINDFSLLRTLPAKHWRNGTSEAVKVALLRDAAFFDWIDAHASALCAFADGRERDADGESAMRWLIRRCAELHLAHITTAGDPFELGSARPLDFGHWAAHKIEQMSRFAIDHGHAVAIGIAIDVTYAKRAALLDAEVAGRILACLRRLGFRVEQRDAAMIFEAGGIDVLLAGIGEFQEHLGGELSITLVRAVGVAEEMRSIDRSLMKTCAEEVLFGGALNGAISQVAPRTSALV